MGHVVLEQASTAADRRGAPSNRTSSTSPAVSSDWVSEMLPWTPMSPPSPAFSSRTKSSTGPSIASAFVHAPRQRCRGRDVLLHGVDEVGERLVVGLRPVVRPPVVHLATEQDGVLRRDHFAEVGLHHLSKWNRNSSGSSATPSTDTSAYTIKTF